MFTPATQDLSCQTLSGPLPRALIFNENLFEFENRPQRKARSFRAVRLLASLHCRFTTYRHRFARAAPAPRAKNRGRASPVKILSHLLPKTLTPGLWSGKFEKMGDHVTNSVFRLYNFAGKRFYPTSCGVIWNQHEKIRRFTPSFRGHP